MKGFISFRFLVLSKRNSTFIHYSLTDVVDFTISQTTSGRLCSQSLSFQPLTKRNECSGDEKTERFCLVEETRIPRGFRRRASDLFCVIYFTKLLSFTKLTFILIILKNVDKWCVTVHIKLARLILRRTLNAIMT